MPEGFKNGIISLMFYEKINRALASKKPFISDRQIIVGLVFSVLINIIHWLILVSNVVPAESLLLRYNVVYGAESVGRSLLLYSIPGAALLFLLLNTWLANYFYSREKLAAYFLNFSSIVVQLVFFTASLVLVIVNG